MKVVFLYLAQRHQIAHSLPIAAEMAMAHPEVEVHVACSTADQEAWARRLAGFYPQARLIFDRLRVPVLARLLMLLRRRSLPPKKLTLRSNRDYLAQFRGAVVPERTSLYIKTLGLSDLKLIWTRHGAGDRQIGYAEDTRGFDFVLMAGRKHEARMLAAGLITPGHYHVGSYAKFDMIRRTAAARARLFDNDRPTVLYNPHFSPELSSWPAMGFEILDWFAAQRDYNLIFAPHVRLFDPPSPKAYARFKRFMALPHMRIDLGSERSIDMTYVMAANLYLGDVSSQVAEFLVEPRPCVFLNPHAVHWHGSPDYLFWTLGPVIEDVAALPRALTQAVAEHPEMIEMQRRYFRESFALPEDVPSARPAADAVIRFLKDTEETT